jgi:non-homologous end joining protein Ku
MFPATSTEGTIAFRMIHEPTGKPIKYLKGIETEQGFEEVPEGEIIKGYEHTKGHHVLINPEEIEARSEAHHRYEDVCRSRPNRQPLFRKALLPSAGWR